MSRPKKGTPKGDEALRKFRETMKLKYGDPTKFYQEIGRKGGENGRGPEYRGGFANSSEKAAEAGAKGGRRSKKGYVFKGMKNGVGVYEKDGREFEYEIKN